MGERLLKFHAAEGGKSFVGIKFSLNEINFYYPETYYWCGDADELKNGISVNEFCKHNEEYFNGIRKILSSIDMAKSRSKEKTRLNDTSEADEPFAMKAYLWIMRDFMRNGYYKNRENVYKTNQAGRINWKRTLQAQPIYSNDSFIYKDSVVSAKSSVDNLIVEIYRFCVRKSNFLVGWLFGIRSLNNGVKVIADVELSDAEKRLYEYSLRYELSRTFDDEKRERIKNMLAVVMGLNKSKDGELVYGVDSYHYVFEQMIDRIYGNLTDEEKALCYPTGFWSNNKRSAPLMPDTILHKDKNYVIIDAKCYRYAFEGYLKGNVEGLPGSDSIQKQLTYGDELNNNVKTRGKTIYNCFIIPYNKCLVSDGIDLMYSKIYSWGGWRKTKNNKQPYEKIYVFFADMRSVIEKWNKQDHSKDHEILIEALKNIQ